MCIIFAHATCSFQHHSELEAEKQDDCSGSLVKVLPWHARTRGCDHDAPRQVMH